MNPETIKRPELYELLAQGATVVTGNSRLAAALQQEYQQQAIDSGQQVWQTPDIRPWAVWLKETWEEAVFDGQLESPVLLLTEQQEQYLWESVIESSSVTVLRGEATAKMAREAWRLLIDWQLDRRLADFSNNEDTQSFQHWADEFEQRCIAQDWLPSSRIAEQLLQCWQGGSLSLSNETLLVGFDELTPLQQDLLAAINSGNGSMRWLQAEQSAAEVRAVRLACADKNDEINTLVKWIRQRLAVQPESRLGIVVPDLSSHRADLLHRLTESLVPANLTADGDQQKPWNISLGLPLMHYPVIEIAFRLLDLVGDGLPIEKLSSLLNSPYLAGATGELASRALLDRRLRDVHGPEVSLQDLCRLAGNSQRSWSSPQLAKHFCKVAELAKEIPGSASPAGWVKWFTGILNQAGWGKDRDFNAGEYQAMEAFHKLLARFSGLQSVCGRLSYSHALSLLKRHARSQIFQPRSESTTLQLLGLYEAIGLEFDALWVMDLHDNVWPASPRPNPFIPLSLQRQKGMPHADQARELSIARGITERLLNAAPDVVMSYPCRAGEEPLRPSPLLQGLVEAKQQDLQLSEQPAWNEIIRQSARVELLSEDSAPALQQRDASGGSGIFKYQSLCPFRAFAQYRLSALALTVPQVGLDAMKRGQLFHHLLELFWREVRDLGTLNGMSEEALGNTLDTVITQAIDEMAAQNPKLFTPRFRDIESTRLKQLTLQWLQIEKQRAAFRVVDFEKEVRAEVNGINVHLWLDRIDELEDGRKLVIDYKTGSVNPSQWFGERPEEPQLPLYSMVEGEGVCAVLFAQLKAAEMKFSGIVEEAGLIPGLPPTRKGPLQEATEQWPQVLEDWQHTINQLAEDFRQGRAEVNPKKPDTCASSYCELSGLCRIDEQRAELTSVAVIRGADDVQGA